LYARARSVGGCKVSLGRIKCRGEDVVRTGVKKIEECNCMARTELSGCRGEDSKDRLKERERKLISIVKETV
jgi:hypothetical protein